MVHTQTEVVPRLAVSVAEAAGLLGISTSLAYRMVAAGELPHRRMHRRIVVPVEGLRSFAEGDS